MIALSGPDAVPRFGFSPTIRTSRYGDKILLWDPPTGSWCFLAEENLPLIQGLKHFCDTRQWDLLPAGSEPLLDELFACGLVSRDGRYCWSRDLFAHHKNKVNTLILKVVGSCNMACSYCYDYNQARFSKLMDLETARQAVDGVWERSGDLLNVLFHGGEPMQAKSLILALVPEIRERAEATGKNVFFSIQTNGTLITEEWCDFFKRYQFSIGVSLDGDASLNDRFRITHSGRGTYEKIVGLLRRHELVSRIGALTTVTRHNIDHLLEIALHFQDLGIELWDTTVFQSAGRGAGQEDLFEPPVANLVDAYLELLEAVEAGRFSTLAVQCLLSYIRNVLSYQRRNMCLRSSCGAGADLVSISVDGAIEACDCITNRELRLGQLKGRESIAQALDSPTAQAIRSRHVDRLLPCKDCDWRIVCGGSCLAKAGVLDGVVESECALSLALFPAILESLSRSDRLIEYADRFA